MRKILVAILIQALLLTGQGPGSAHASQYSRHYIKQQTLLDSSPQALREAALLAERARTIHGILEGKTQIGPITRFRINRILPGAQVSLYDAGVRIVTGDGIEFVVDDTEGHSGQEIIDLGGGVHMHVEQIGWDSVNSGDGIDETVQVEIEGDVRGRIRGTLARILQEESGHFARSGVRRIHVKRGTTKQELLITFDRRGITVAASGTIQPDTLRQRIVSGFDEEIRERIRPSPSRAGKRWIASALSAAAVVAILAYGVSQIDPSPIYLGFHTSAEDLDPIRAEVSREVQEFRLEAEEGAEVIFVMEYVGYYAIDEPEEQARDLFIRMKRSQEALFNEILLQERTSGKQSRLRDRLGLIITGQDLVFTNDLLDFLRDVGVDRIVFERGTFEYVRDRSVTLNQMDQAHTKFLNGDFAASQDMLRGMYERWRELDNEREPRIAAHIKSVRDENPDSMVFAYLGIDHAGYKFDSVLKHGWSLSPEITLEKDEVLRDFSGGITYLFRKRAFGEEVTDQAVIDRAFATNYLYGVMFEYVDRLGIKGRDAMRLTAKLMGEANGNFTVEEMEELSSRLGDRMNTPTAALLSVSSRKDALKTYILSIILAWLKENDKLEPIREDVPGLERFIGGQGDGLATEYGWGLGLEYRLGEVTPRFFDVHGYLRIPAEVEKRGTVLSTEGGWKAEEFVEGAHIAMQLAGDLFLPMQPYREEDGRYVPASYQDDKVSGYYQQRSARSFFYQLTGLMRDAMASDEPAGPGGRFEEAIELLDEFRRVHQTLFRRGAIDLDFSELGYFKNTAVDVDGHVKVQDIGSVRVMQRELAEVYINRADIHVMGLMEKLRFPKELVEHWNRTGGFWHDFSLYDIGSQPHVRMKPWESHILMVKSGRARVHRLEEGTYSSRYDPGDEAFDYTSVVEVATGRVLGIYRDARAHFRVSDSEEGTGDEGDLYVENAPFVRFRYRPDNSIASFDMHGVPDDQAFEIKGSGGKSMRISRGLLEHYDERGNLAGKITSGGRSIPVESGDGLVTSAGSVLAELDAQLNLDPVRNALEDARRNSLGTVTASQHMLQAAGAISEPQDVMAVGLEAVKFINSKYLGRGGQRVAILASEEEALDVKERFHGWRVLMLEETLSNGYILMPSEIDTAVFDPAYSEFKDPTSRISWTIAQIQTLVRDARDLLSGDRVPNAHTLELFKDAARWALNWAA